MFEEIIAKLAQCYMAAKSRSKLIVGQIRIISVYLVKNTVYHLVNVVVAIFLEQSLSNLACVYQELCHDYNGSNQTIYARVIVPYIVKNPEYHLANRMDVPLLEQS